MGAADHDARGIEPPIAPDELAALAGKSYPEIAWFVLRRFTAGALDDARLRALC